MEAKQPRVLGAQRTLAEAVSSQVQNEETKQLISRIASSSADNFTLSELEQALCYFTNHNSNYTNVGEDEFHILAEETLNNSIRSILVYDDFSGYFGDAEVFSLSMAFQYNLSVEALTLSGINVSDESISALCDALIRSRVNYLDLSNTPLEDEAGRSIAALAHLNPYLRTVIVDDTLIAEEVLDEIDVACQFNQSNYESCDNEMDEAVFLPAHLARLKHRLQQTIRAKKRQVYFCAAHLYGCCPNDDLCFYSHALGHSGMAEGNPSLASKLTELFAQGGAWEEKLPPRPSDGASWRHPDEVGRRPTLNWTRRNRLNGQRGASGPTTPPLPNENHHRRFRLAPLVTALCGMCGGIVMVGIVAVVAQRLAQKR